MNVGFQALKAILLITVILYVRTSAHLTLVDPYVTVKVVVETLSKIFGIMLSRLSLS